MWVLANGFLLFSRVGVASGSKPVQTTRSSLGSNGESVDLSFSKIHTTLASYYAYQVRDSAQWVPIPLHDSPSLKLSLIFVHTAVAPPNATFSASANVVTENALPGLAR